MKTEYVADYSRCSDVGLVRKANEDNCDYRIATPNGDLFVVCDGMGGHAGGAVASKIAVESIVNYFQQQQYPDVQQALNDAVCCANMQILGRAQEDPALKGMGTTACIVLVQGEAAYIAHCGDSRIYLYVAGEKYLHRITEDHSYVMSLVKSGELDDREAEHHPKKNIILRALGIKSNIEPEVAPQAVLPARGDIFLICSDGLSGMVDDNGIEAILQQDVPLEQKTAALIQAAKDGGGKDNITVQLIQVIDSRRETTWFVDKNPKWRQKPVVVQIPKTSSLKIDGGLLKKIKIVAAVLAAFWLLNLVILVSLPDTTASTTTTATGKRIKKVENFCRSIVTFGLYGGSKTESNPKTK
jgi:serine/threonine protein phosphatase PrpC